ncbi:auxin-responsive protein SAUR50 [Malania oleifera]|uniref:auxin-responsive protein SAUR50 n=1 Tax=Malania oleifera TaxID=397392 RepID=UPI0025ADFEF0|nr:auxin-responsive protein SAUR50 [Malania oleifera]
MGMLRSSDINKKNNVNINGIVKKLRRSLFISKKQPFSNGNSFEDSSAYVPEDVKEGHFAVIAVGAGEKPKRFIVPLTSLTHPAFVSLLEHAAEEYGFYHQGALTVPCRPSELERILAEQCWPELRRRPRVQRRL